MEDEGGFGRVVLLLVVMMVAAAAAATVAVVVWFASRTVSNDNDWDSDGDANRESDCFGSVLVFVAEDTAIVVGVVVFWDGFIVKDDAVNEDDIGVE